MTQETRNNESVPDADSYDYLIVGGGSAGCVLANRLSADSDNRVCVLEAGPRDWNPLIRIPVGIIALMRSRLFNWGYYTEPQSRLNGRSLFWPRGKTLGGSSSINAQCYTRGNAADYDHWAELGNRGWGYRDLLPYFRQSENYEAGAGENEYHGVGGGYNVSKLRYTNPLSEVFLRAAEECGFPRNDDFNGPSEEGFGFYNVAQKDGERCSNADAFLHPVEDRPNLTIRTRARATRILFEGKRAVGVEYKKWRFGRRRRVYAKREVILAGGAINSPQLLLLSGVGPRAELQRHGIELQHELPGVGQNLQDHLDINVISKETTRESLNLGPRWVLFKGIPAVFRYLFRHEGPLVSNVAECGGFVKLDSADPVPSLQLHFIAAIEQDHGHKLWNTFLYHGYSLRVCDLRPLSRGHIGLKSANPMADARIEANYLEADRDMENLVAGVKLARRLLAADAFAPHRGDELEPGADVRSDEQIREFIRERAETIYHPVGTCKMGHDELAVVDDRLRVHGLEGLRVIDASIMPTLVGGNTNAPTTAIAEKGAEMILEDKTEG